jgi:hypothetical protein
MRWRFLSASGVVEPVDAGSRQRSLGGQPQVAADLRGDGRVVDATAMTRRPAASSAASVASAAGGAFSQRASLDSGAPLVTSVSHPVSSRSRTEAVRRPCPTGLLVVYGLHPRKAFAAALLGRR